jgi:hypothetical protein
MMMCIGIGARARFYLGSISSRENDLMFSVV